LDAAYKYHYQNSFMTWYQNTDTFKIAARSANPDIREMYDQTYQFIKGTYKPTFRPSSEDHGQATTEDDSDPAHQNMLTMHIDTE
jgi:hypothetical protein